MWFVNFFNEITKLKVPNWNCIYYLQFCFNRRVNKWGYFLKNDFTFFLNYFRSIIFQSMEYIFIIYYLITASVKGALTYKIQKCCAENELLNEWYECESTQLKIIKILQESCTSSECEIVPMKHLICPQRDGSSIICLHTSSSWFMSELQFMIKLKCYARNYDDRTQIWLLFIATKEPNSGNF